jgi:hypothetical protein
MKIEYINSGLMGVFLGVLLSIFLINQPETEPDSGISYHSSGITPINPFDGVDGFRGQYLDPVGAKLNSESFRQKAREAGYVPVSEYGAVKLEGSRKTVIHRYEMGDQVVYEYEDVSHLDPAQAYIWALKGRPLP